MPVAFKKAYMQVHNFAESKSFETNVEEDEES